jgi:hypothetical protein
LGLLEQLSDHLIALNFQEPTQVVTGWAGHAAAGLSLLLLDGLFGLQWHAVACSGMQ